MKSARAHFAQGEYGPELLRLMTEALDGAWLQAREMVRDAELGRLVLASAIIEQVDRGVRSPEALIESAKQALAAALRLSCGGAPRIADVAD